MTRLSQKPGVQSTLILSRSTGAIVRTSGLVSTILDEFSDGDLTGSPTATKEKHEVLSSPQRNGTSTIGRRDSGARERGGLRSADDVARLVWTFFSSAGGMVEEMMGTEDEVKMLRLRTKRNELLIVPGEYHITSQVCSKD